MLRIQFDFRNDALPFLCLLLNLIFDGSNNNKELLSLSKPKQIKQIVSFEIHLGFLGVLVLKSFHQVHLVDLRDNGDEEIEENNQHEVQMEHPNCPY